MMAAKETLFHETKDLNLSKLTVQDDKILKKKFNGMFLWIQTTFIQYVTLIHDK